MEEQAKRRIAELVEHTLREEPAHRSEFLRQACAGDDALLAEVESLVGEYERAAGTRQKPGEVETQTLLLPGFAVGKTIGNRFRVIRFIGHGGMGDVYEAEDMLQSRQRRVALKTIRPEIASNPQVKKQFEGEIALGQLITHPNVCRIYDIGIHRDEGNLPPIMFLSMELLNGRTLAEHLRSSGPMQPSDALPLIRQLGAALDAAHQVNIIHRDFKPGNVMLVESRGSDQMRAVVTDFGLATEVADDGLGGRTGSGAGTPDYMSPEQVKGEASGPACDIYAFGVVVYQMVTGKMPFEGETAMLRMVKRLHEAPVPPQARVASLPSSWNTALLRCMEREPANRFGNIREALTALEEQSPVTPSPERSRPRSWRMAYAIALVAVMVLIALAIRGVWKGSSSAPSVRSMAVLPFENVSGDAEWQYLADGLTESMINRLSRIRDLTVMSRSAVFRIKKTETDAIEQGRRLAVDAILTGSIRHFPDHLEASFELVDCATGRHLWGQQYRQMFVDPLTFEKSAVEDTATQLRAQLSQTEKRIVLHDYTEDTNAYRLYLKGRYEWNKRNQRGYEEAIRYFQQALDVDPSYALAYAGMADAYSGENDFLPPAEVFPKARAAADRALKIDPDLPEAHTSLGLIHVQYDWDWAPAEMEFRRAMQLNPSYPSAHSMYARLLCVLGRFPEAEAEVARAQKLDPLSMGIANGVGRTYYFARDFRRAGDQFKASLALVPNPVTTSYLAQTNAAAGHAPEAVSEYEGLLKADPSDFETMAYLTQAYALAGRSKDALNLYERLRNSPGVQSLLPTSLATASAALNRLDDAFAQLDRAYREKCWYLIFLKVDPLFDPLRQDSRYRALLRKMNLGD